MKQTLTIEYGDEVLIALGISPQQFSKEVSLLTAIKLYEMGRLSAGAASGLAGIPKPIFLSRLIEYDVNSFQQTEDELRQEMENVRCHQ